MDDLLTIRSNEAVCTSLEKIDKLVVENSTTKRFFSFGTYKLVTTKNLEI